MKFDTLIKFYFIYTAIVAYLLLWVLSYFPVCNFDVLVSCVGYQLFEIITCSKIIVRNSMCSKLHTFCILWFVIIVTREIETGKINTLEDVRLTALIIHCHDYRHLDNIFFNFSIQFILYDNYGILVVAFHYLTSVCKKL